MGLATSTVSRALNGHPGLPPETIARVRARATEMGYQPNTLVSAVMRHVRGLGKENLRGVIAYLTFGQERQAWRKHLTYVSFFEGARMRAQSMGFGLEEIWADEPGLGGKRLAEILRARGITGVVVGPAFGLPAAPQLRWEDFAAVKIGVPLPGLCLPCAVSHHFQAMQLVIERARAHGYHRLGLALQEHHHLKTASRWLAPFTFYEQHSRPTDRVAPLVLRDWNEKAFGEWFTAHRPDLVVGLRYEIVEWVRRLGFTVPEQVGFVHLDAGTEAQPCAGIDQKSREIGAAAIDLLINRLLANERGVATSARTLLIDGEWVEGPTIRPLPKAVRA